MREDEQCDTATGAIQRVCSLYRSATAIRACYVFTWKFNWWKGYIVTKRTAQILRVGWGKKLWGWVLYNWIWWYWLDIVNNCPGCFTSKSPSAFGIFHTHATLWNLLKVQANLSFCNSKFSITFAKKKKKKQNKNNNNKKQKKDGLILAFFLFISVSRDFHKAVT